MLVVAIITNEKEHAEIPISWIKPDGRISCFQTKEKPQVNKISYQKNRDFITGESRNICEECGRDIPALDDICDDCFKELMER